MKRTELARGAVPLKRGSRLARRATATRRPAQRPTSPPKSGDWPPQVRDAVQGRSGGLCEVRIDGKCTGKATDLHHRQPRRTRRHTAGNALALCRRCHQAVHTLSPALSAHEGWTVTTHLPDPAAQPVRIGGSWLLLHDDGTTTPTGAPL